MDFHRRNDGATDGGHGKLVFPAGTWSCRIFAWFSSWTLASDSEHVRMRFPSDFQLRRASTSKIDEQKRLLHATQRTATRQLAWSL
jgi:hypothetical protein